jgi:hypothetical protein
MPQTNEISELKRKLHERIVEQRQKRNAPGSGTTKARSREAILAERLKKKQDRKKAIKSQKEKGNKVAPEELVKDPTKSSSVKTHQPQQSQSLCTKVLFSCFLLFLGTYWKCRRLCENGW